ncbi:GNAT family N-acetyltransferase [Shewanella maritima]|uniref:GNAT family N-acetyltransferase n=1 Tax=Shewanella maritima TaxID=2520507 RepID=UPI0037359572
MSINLFSERLLIRPLKESDWHSVLSLQSSQIVNQFIRDIEDEQIIRAKFEQRMQLPEFDSGDWYSLAIESLNTGEFIGITGFYCQDVNSKRVEVGYMISPTFFGQGYASESLQTVIDWGLHQFEVRKFVAQCCKQNVASQRVLQKCGFSLEGELVENTVINNKIYDDYLYGLLSRNRQLP